MAAAFLRFGTVADPVLAAEACRAEDHPERLLAREGTLEPRKLLAEELRTTLEELSRREAPAEESALADDFGYDKALLPDKVPVSLPSEEALRIEAACVEELRTSCMPEGVKTRRAAEPVLALSILADPRFQGAAWSEELAPRWEEREMDPAPDADVPRAASLEEIGPIRRTDPLPCWKPWEAGEVWLEMDLPALQGAGAPRLALWTEPTEEELPEEIRRTDDHPDPAPAPPPPPPPAPGVVLEIDRLLRGTVTLPPERALDEDGDAPRRLPELKPELRPDGATLDLEVDAEGARWMPSELPREVAEEDRAPTAEDPEGAEKDRDGAENEGREGAENDRLPLDGAENEGRDGAENERLPLEGAENEGREGAENDRLPLDGAENERLPPEGAEKDRDPPPREAPEERMPPPPLEKPPLRPAPPADMPPRPCAAAAGSRPRHTKALKNTAVKRARFMGINLSPWTRLRSTRVL